MEIKLLDKDKYKGHKLDFSYVSEFYYDLKVDSVIGEYKAYLQKKKFDIPFVNPAGGWIGCMQIIGRCRGLWHRVKW